VIVFQDYDRHSCCHRSRRSRRSRRHHRECHEEHLNLYQLQRDIYQYREGLIHYQNFADTKFDEIRDLVLKQQDEIEKLKGHLQEIESRTSRNQHVLDRIMNGVLSI